MFEFFKNISPKELVVLVVIIAVFVLFFGAKTVTGIGKSSGETFREIKNIKKNFTEAISEEEPKKEEKGVSK